MDVSPQKKLKKPLFSLDYVPDPNSVLSETGHDTQLTDWPLKVGLDDLRVLLQPKRLWFCGHTEDLSLTLLHFKGFRWSKRHFGSSGC